MCGRELYTAQRQRMEMSLRQRGPLKQYQLQLSNCKQRKRLWEHIGNIWSQLPKPAKRQIRETEITIKYCLPGKGLIPSGA